MARFLQQFTPSRREKLRWGKLWYRRVLASLWAMHRLDLCGFCVSPFKTEAVGCK